jgi:hypothetical protein
MHVQHLAEGLGVTAEKRISYYYNGGGARLAQPAPAPAPAPVPTTTVIPLIKADPYIYTPPEQRTILTTEQLEVMRDRAIAAEGELEARQYSEDGDGVAEDLEREANETNATAKAVEDGADIKVSKAEPNNAGLLILAALGYFLFF